MGLTGITQKDKTVGKKEYTIGDLCLGDYFLFEKPYNYAVCRLVAVTNNYFNYIELFSQGDTPSREIWNKGIGSSHVKGVMKPNTPVRLITNIDIMYETGH